MIGEAYRRLLASSSFPGAHSGQSHWDTAIHPRAGFDFSDESTVLLQNPGGNPRGRASRLEDLTLLWCGVRCLHHHDHLSFTSAVELAEKDSLPAAEQQLTVFERHGH
jgi:hypothetical protein